MEDGEREDGDNEDHIKLMGLDYYNGRGLLSREDYFEFTSQEHQQLSSKREDNIVILVSTYLLPLGTYLPIQKKSFIELYLLGMGLIRRFRFDILKKDGGFRSE